MHAWVSSRGESARFAIRPAASVRLSDVSSVSSMVHLGSTRDLSAATRYSSRMPKTESFDITTGVDLQEVDNALNQARKEIATRFDFKNVLAEIEYDRHGP